MGAAAAARIPDAGATVGLVLLVADSGGGGVDAGLITVCLNLPHLLGPLLARRLDGAGDGRRFIAACCVAYGALLGAAALTVGVTPLAVSLACVVAAGVCGPVLTAGLSSQLSLMVPAAASVQRRAQGLDALTYGVAGSAGPAVVAAVAVAATPLVALLALSGAAVVAAALMLTLPQADLQGGAAAGGALRPRQVLVRVLASGPLRRATVAMTVTSFVGGSIAILAVGRGIGLAGDAESGAVIAAVYGIGSLAGSVFTAAVPPGGEPDRATTRWALALGVTFVLGGFAPTLGTAFAAFAAAGFLTAPFFVATLAVRSAYSPAAGRAQVFVAMGALKITAAGGGGRGGGPGGVGAAGTALTAGGAGVLVAGALLVLDRRRTAATRRRTSTGRGADA